MARHLLFVFLVTLIIYASLLQVPNNLSPGYGEDMGTVYDRVHPRSLRRGTVIEDGSKLNFTLGTAQKTNEIRENTQIQFESYPKQTLKINDIFITVKTTGRVHKKRLTPIVKTWFQKAPKQVNLYEIYIFI